MNNCVFFRVSSDKMAAQLAAGPYLVPGNRGGNRQNGNRSVILIFHAQRYVRNSSTRGGMNWRCALYGRYKCRATLQTNLVNFAGRDDFGGININVLNLKGNHNHCQQQDLILKERFRRKCLG